MSVEFMLKTRFSEKRGKKSQKCLKVDLEKAIRAESVAKFY